MSFRTKTKPSITFANTNITVRLHSEFLANRSISHICSPIHTKLWHCTSFTYLLTFFLRLVVSCQEEERYLKAVDFTAKSLVTDAVDRMLMIRNRKRVVIDESARDDMEQPYATHAVCTPEHMLTAPVRTSTPADVCFLLFNVYVSAV